MIYVHRTDHAPAINPLAWVLLFQSGMRYPHKAQSTGDDAFIVFSFSSTPAQLRHATRIERRRTSLYGLADMRGLRNALRQNSAETHQNDHLPMVKIRDLSYKLRDCGYESAFPENCGIFTTDQLAKRVWP